MSHRAEDAYEYVALEDIHTGTVTAFHVGDPVPAGTVEDHGWLDAGLVIHKDLYSPEGDHASEETTPVLRRGDIPPHLQGSTEVTVADAPAAAKSSARKSTTATKAD